MTDGFDDDVFIRNIDADVDPAWAMKLLPYITALAELKRAVDAARAPTSQPEEERPE